MGPTFLAKAGNQTWIIFAAQESRHFSDRRSTSQRGLYIFNLETQQRSQYLSGHTYNTLVQASDCPKTFFYLRVEHVVVLELGEDGRVSERFSFRVSGYYRTIVAASKKRVLVSIAGVKIGFYNAITGELNGTLDMHLRHYSTAVISHTRNEVLALEIIPPIFSEGRTSVCAFCFEEPHL